MSLSLSIHALVERNLHLTGCLMGGSGVALEAMELISAGTIQPLIAEQALSQVPTCMQQIADGETVGKIVIRMDGDPTEAST